MSTQLFSLEQIASQLGLHVRTVRGYVREGKLKAFRIGKQYRVTGEDLQAFTGQVPAASMARAGVRRERHVEVSSIVQVDAIGSGLASRIATALQAVAGGRERTDQPLRIDTIYDETHARLKVILTGSLPTCTALLGLVERYLEA